MNAKDLVNLMFSPPWIAKLLHHFFSGAQHNNSQGIKLELMYLLIPFIIDDATKETLVTAKTSSSFASLFQNKLSLEIKNALVKKNEQVKQFREVTNHGFIYLTNTVELDISDFIVLANKADYKKEKGINRDYCKAAYYLGVVLAKEDYRSVFIKLGITNL